MLAVDTLKTEGEDFKKRFPEVFHEGLGRMKGIIGRIVIQKDAVPKFCKASTICNERESRRRVKEIGSRRYYRSCKVL